MSADDLAAMQALTEALKVASAWAAVLARLGWWLLWLSLGMATSWAFIRGHDE